MRLLAIEQARFGTLDVREPLQLAPGLNICVAPNQAGKSTLLTLIEWLLYGVPPRGRRRSHEQESNQCRDPRSHPHLRGYVADVLAQPVFQFQPRSRIRPVSCCRGHV